MNTFGVAKLLTRMFTVTCQNFTFLRLCLHVIAAALWPLQVIKMNSATTVAA